MKIFLSIFPVFFIWNITSSNAEPYFGLPSYPIRVTSDIVTRIYPIISKIFYSIETLRTTTYPFRNSESPLIQVGIGTSRALFTSMNDNVGTYTGPFGQLILMTINAIKDGHCSMEKFNELLNEYNKFDASLSGIIPYYSAYVNQVVGDNLTSTFQAISTEMVGLYQSVDSLTHQSNQEYADTSKKIELFTLSTAMTQYSNELITHLTNLLPLWTTVEYQLKQLIPSILTNQEIFARVDRPVSSTIPPKNASLVYFGKISENVFNIYGNFLYSVSRLITLYTTNFQNFIGRYYSDDIVLKNWTNGQLAKQNATYNECNTQLNNVYLYMYDVNYNFMFEITTVYNAAVKEMISDIYKELSTIVLDVNQYLLKATACAQTASWALVTHYYKYFADLASCMYTKIFRLWLLYPQFVQMLFRFQNSYIVDIIGKFYPCAFKSWNRGKASDRLAVSECLDGANDILKFECDYFYNVSTQSASQYKRDCDALATLCNDCINQVVELSKLNIQKINTTYFTCRKTAKVTSLTRPKTLDSNETMTFSIESLE